MAKELELSPLNFLTIRIEVSVLEALNSMTARSKADKEGATLMTPTLNYDSNSTPNNPKIQHE